MKNDQLLSMRAYYALLICFFLILLGVGRALSQSAAASWTWEGGGDPGQGVYGTMGVPAPSNNPGARHGAVSWTDASGVLWLFGGYGHDANNSSGSLNDLWKYDGTNWTWVSGSNTTNASGIYGTLGTAVFTNIPGARTDAVSWTDASGTLWLFGGYGLDANGSYGHLNDLWKYDGTNWTWVSGSNTVNASGNYGTQGTAAPDNVPGARNGAVSWTDVSGGLWLFGGYGLDASGGYGSLNDLWKYDITKNEWTWVSGSNTEDASGNYGTLGTAAPDNVPGARNGAVSWTDPSGVLWLFGGVGLGEAYGVYGYAGYLNDLWKYDGINWTWVSGSDAAYAYGTYGTQGIAALTNIPGPRNRAISYVDALGILWLFGGYGRDAGGSDGALNDLWKYDGTNWTWVSGSNTIRAPGNYGTKGTAASTNFSGARSDAVSWRDVSGALWLFGGYGSDTNGNSGTLNDLWKYDGTHWTWVSGSNTAYAPGTYGTQGTAASTNIPGARSNAVSWTDASGVLWLFGGDGHDANGNDGFLNDLWKYDGTNWTWVSGSDTAYASGSYGTKGTAAPDNVPGARGSAMSWIGTSDVLWLFGGEGRDANGNDGFLNDLWKYDITENNWTWVSGSDTIDAGGIHGDQGIPVPEARHGAVSWTDTSGALWLFGGEGLDASGIHGYLNDLWKYDGTNWTWVSESNTIYDSGIYGYEDIPDSVPGVRYNAVSWTDASGVLWLFGGVGYDEADRGYGYGYAGNLNDLWKYDGIHWTRVSGSNTINASGIYGTKGIPAPGNTPGAREDAVSWTDASGALWLFGGYGYDANGSYGRLNDLWKYDGTNWTWVSGSDTKNTPGTPGTYGTAAPDNVPGARSAAVSWTDASGGLWLFGGSSSAGSLNDLWKLQIGNGPTFTSTATTATFEENSTGTVINVDAHNGDGGGTDDGVTYSLSGNDAGKFRISSAGVITFVTSPDFEKPADKGGDNVYNIIVQASDGVFAATQSLTITVTNTNDNAPVFTSAVTASVPENTTAVVTLATTDADGQSKITYRLSGGVDKALFTILDDKLLFIKAPDFEKPADANGDNHFILTVAAGDGKHETEISIDVEVINDKGDHVLSTSADLRLSVYPNPATDVLTVEGTLKEGELQLVNLMGVTVLRQQFTGRARLELAHLPDGLYLLRLHSGHKYSTYKVMKK